MARSSRQGREELVMRIQMALQLSTKKETERHISIFISVLEDTLVDHLAEDGYSIKLGGLGKLMVHHRPSKRRKIGFSAETREIPPTRKVKFLSLGKLRELESIGIDQSAIPD